MIYLKKQIKIYKGRPIDLVNSSQTHHHFTTTGLRLQGQVVSDKFSGYAQRSEWSAFKMAHHRFLARTIVVENGVASALRSLQRVLTQEYVMRDIRLKRYYEKPTIKRRRVKYESALRLYNSEMKKKVDFLMEKQRKETPWS